MLPKAADCGKESIGGGEKGDIWNVDGTLRCTFTSEVSQSHRDIFNILSISSDTKDSSGETKVWRIDHPDVIAPLSTYPQITIKPGDLIQGSQPPAACKSVEWVTRGSCTRTRAGTIPTGSIADC